MASVIYTQMLVVPGGSTRQHELSTETLLRIPYLNNRYILQKGNVIEGIEARW